MNSRCLQKHPVIPQSVGKNDRVLPIDLETLKETDVEEVEAIEEEAFDELVDMFGVALR